MKIYKFVSFLHSCVNDMVMVSLVRQYVTVVL